VAQCVYRIASRVIVTEIEFVDSWEDVTEMLSLPHEKMLPKKGDRGLGVEGLFSKRQGSQQLLLELIDAQSEFNQVQVAIGLSHFGFVFF
jgi:hypothetical protein